MEFRLSRRPLIFLCILLPLACSKPENQAAKRRVFSPEGPTASHRDALIPLDVARISSDPALAMRVLAMPAEEAVARLGPHKLSAGITFGWTIDKKTLGLGETRHLELARGDFLVRVENDRDQGFEVVRSGERTFFRSRYLPFRERRLDRGQAERMRDENHAAFAAFAELCDWKLKLTPRGEEVVAGRKTRRFDLAVGTVPLIPAPGIADDSIPPVQYPAKGPNKQMTRRMEFEESRSPKTITGTLWVDEQTGVLLRAEASAEIRVTSEPEEDPPPAPELMGELDSDAGLVDGGLPPKPRPVPVDNGPKEAMLKVGLSHKIFDIGHPASIPPPEDYLPDEDRPSGIAGALKRFGLGKNAAVVPPPVAAPVPED